MKRNLWRGVGMVSLLVFALLLLHPVMAEAQAEGPRVYLLAPVDMNVLVGTYMSMSSNFNFAGTILIKDADISSDVGVVTYMRYFSIGGHFAQLWVAPVWGSVDLRYQNGGETVTDGVPDDNRMGQLGAGLSLGYSITPAWMLQATYGEIVAANDDSEGRNLRLRLSYAF